MVNHMRSRIFINSEEEEKNYPVRIEEKFGRKSVMIIVSK